MEHGVIILDGHLKSALSAVRSLGRARVCIVCGAERGSAIARHSKYVTETFTYPSPKDAPKEFVQSILTEVKHLFEKTGEKVPVFGFSDATVLQLSFNRELLSPYCELGFPSEHSVAVASDKQQSYAMAHTLSIPTIRTYTSDAFESVTYPAVVKNNHSIVWNDDTSTSGSAHFVFSREELVSVYERIQSQTGESPLVMEFITGDEYGVEMVCENGAPLATYVHKRIRSLSPRGGAAVVKETAANTEVTKEMVVHAQRLVSELQWQGPVMVEFKIDSRDGSVRFMEINGRFWGSLPLAVASGVDFPRIAYELSRGVAIKPSALSPRFVRTRHFLGDCKWLLSVLFAKDPLRARLYPSRIKAVFHFIYAFFTTKGDVFSVTDVMPSIYEYIDILNKWRLKA